MATPTGNKREYGAGWMSGPEIVELARAALEQFDFMDLANKRRELEFPEKPLTKSELESRELELSDGVRRAFGQFLIHALHMGIQPPKNQTNDAQKNRAHQAQKSRDELSDIATAAIHALLQSCIEKALATTLTNAIAPLYQELATIKSAQEKTGNAVENMLKNPRTVLAALEHGPLRKRYESDYFQEKVVIAKYLAQTVFSERVSCFLQASTTIVHLAEILREQGLKEESLIHTNSTTFPFLMLGRNPRFQIYPVGGKEHDANCGGWLFDESDHVAVEHVKSLFQREPAKNPLTVAIVTPQFLTIDGRAWFANPKTACLVNILINESPKVIITSPAQRIYVSEGKLHESPGMSETTFRDVRLFRAKNETEIVVAGKLERLTNGRQDLQCLSSSVNATCRFRELDDSQDWDVIPPS